MNRNINNTDKNKERDVDEKIKIIDIIINMYPDLKKDKQEIINAVFDKLNKPNKYIFTKILHNNLELYVDSDGLLLTKKLEFKGFVINNKFYMTDDIEKDNELININKYYKIMFKYKN